MTISGSRSRRRLKHEGSAQTVPLVLRKGVLTIAFKAIALSDLPTSHKQVAAALLDHFNRTNGRCDPSMGILAFVLNFKPPLCCAGTEPLGARRAFSQREAWGQFLHQPIYPRLDEIPREGRCLAGAQTIAPCTF